MRQLIKLKIILTLILNVGLSSTKSQSLAFDRTVAIIQNGKTITPTTLYDTIKLNRDSFSIRFNCRKYDDKANKFQAVQIAAVTEDSCLHFIRAGQQLNDIPFFQTGTGLAAEEFGYNNLFIDNEAHHYITYTDDKDRRAILILQNDQVLTLEWKLPMAFYKGEDVSFKNLPVNKIHLLLVNNDNLNTTIDEGEYVVLTVIFD